ncbi:MAG: glycine cleavage system aminomethyltransferase GcvT, partial [Gammaproteobacteria bacterium]
MSPDAKETTGSLNRTPLHSLHLELGAKMTAFAGYHLPLHYPNGTIREHLHTRDYAGFFDISHMGQIRLTGANAGAELEKLTPGAFAGLPDNRLRYTVFTNDKGGIVDDLVVGRMGGGWQLTVNAACKQKDIALLQNRIPECRPELLEDRALLALQGPRAAPVLRPLITAGSIDIPFMSMTEAHFHGIDCLVSRCGYTGEDGFEISVDARYAENLARLLLAQDGVEPAGLGARDTLRLEAGLCLYGHDIDGETNPVEAGLSWLVDQSYLATEAPRKA